MVKWQARLLESRIVLAIRHTSKLEDVDDLIKLLVFASQGEPPVSTTPVANSSTIFASGKFVTSVNDAGGQLPPV
jgi:hypothetical protein